MEGDDTGEVTLQEQVAALQAQLLRLQTAGAPANNVLGNASGGTATSGGGSADVAEVGTRVKPVKNVPLPVGVYTMSPSEYRTYRKDVKDCQILNQHSDRQIVMEMRLKMDTDLKCSIDINYGSHWDSYNVDAALEAVQKIVLRTSNVVVYQKEFDGMIQNVDESIREYVTRLRTCATDCSFVCPYDDSHDLTDYHLIRKLRCGVASKTLQQELFQKHQELNTVHAIVTYCEAYESAINDRDKLSSASGSGLSVSHISAQFDLPEEEVVSAVSQYKQSKKKSFVKSKQNKIQSDFNNLPCDRCGNKHPENSCRAINKICLCCGKTGHLARVCQSKACATCGKKSHPDGKCSVGDIINSAVVIGSILKVLAVSESCGVIPLPQVSVKVGDGAVMVVGDTGAMVTVAGPTFLRRLQLEEDELLQPSSNLKHVGGGKITVLGYCNINMELNEEAIVEPVFFVLGLDMVFLSLSACKKFRLVHQSFPHCDVQRDGDLSIERREREVVRKDEATIATVDAQDMSVCGDVGDGGVGTIRGST